MARARAALARLRWRPWAERTQVERVDLYTRQSLYALLWFFQGFAVLGVLAGDRPAAVAVACGGIVVALAATALLRTAMALWPAVRPLPRRALGVVVVSAAVVLAGVPLLPPDDRGAGVLLALWPVCWGTGALRDRRVTVTLAVALGVLPPALTGQWWLGAYGLLYGALFVFTVRASLWLHGVVAELDRARSAQAALAVAEERLRFSRDVHDVVGRHLATIAVGSELAASLAERGDARAPAQMLEVRGVAHRALREARELARGYRAPDLRHELEGARALLGSAGIEADVDVDGLPAAWHEAAGWVVREAVTNVLRHSEATRVSLRWWAPWLEVRNDGVAAVAPGGGSGLLGLRERLAPLGAGLEVRRGDGEFALLVELPGAGPGAGATPAAAGAASGAGAAPGAGAGPATGADCPGAAAPQAAASGRGRRGHEPAPAAGGAP